MIIKVLGPGCPSCKRLHENVKEAVIMEGGNIEVKYISDLQEIMASGVMSMPALVINDKVISMGRIVTPSEIVEMIKKS
ncbi:MAG: thioredoxin family protein, partial [Bacilli bacterium]|nr:thioredoxin family protein [Bacilli bacterium]